MNHIGGKATPRARSFMRLSGGSGDGAAIRLVRELVRALRLTDPEGSWSFLRLIDGHGSRLGLWLNTTAGAHAALDDILHTAAGRPDRPVSVDRYEPPNGSDLPQGVAVDENICTASSEFALAVLGEQGRLALDDPSPLALLHLWRVLHLIRARDRSHFLFLYWRHGTVELTPSARVALASLTEARTSALLRATADLQLHPATHQRHEHYLDALRRTVLTRRRLDNGPANYLVFTHSQLTDNRLGIPPSVASGAAWALRAAIITDPTLATLPHRNLIPAASGRPPRPGKARH